jgi:hypothetical protein
VFPEPPFQEELVLFIIVNMERGRQEKKNQPTKSQKKKKTRIQMKDTINSKPKVLANSETPTRSRAETRESLVDDKLLSKDNEYNTGSTNV